ncbi:hypothetical protein ASE63_24830 [Bosea sp. Root381]|nr:hypothetical protein ASE63_24830 [Bosea sp. Root381]
MTSCAGHLPQFGLGFAELPASQGWEPLPIGTWVLNDGIEARTMVFCPRDSCLRQGFAALIAFEGRRGRDMEKALSEQPGALARSFARLASEASAERRKSTKPAKPVPDRSSTDFARFEAEGAGGILVTIRSKERPARQAVTAILYRREGERLVVALAVSADAAAAKADATAAWRSR